MAVAGDADEFWDEEPDGTSYELQIATEECYTGVGMRYVADKGKGRTHNEILMGPSLQQCAPLHRTDEGRWRICNVF